MVKYSALRAADRARLVLDEGSFLLLEPQEESGTLVLASGLLGGIPVVMALTDGHVRGGTVGVQEAEALLRLAERVVHGRVGGRRPVGLVLGLDTGGVRVEEGPRALAAASAFGAALARLTIEGIPVAAVISGPRGCFGAPSVMAALPARIIMTADAHWGLTGPRLFRPADLEANPGAGYEATAAVTHLANGDVHAVVPDQPEAVRTQLCDFTARARLAHDRRTPTQHIVSSCDVLHGMLIRLRGNRPTAEPGRVLRPRRPRDLLRYSFRGQWKPGETVVRQGLVHASLGTLEGRPALSIIVGPEADAGNGIGIEEAAVITDMVRQARQAPSAEPALILIFLFCQGHAVDLSQESFGLPRALAECLRSLVAARLCGHPLISVLGGGAYGAAFLSLAAPSHRILALEGTAVAPMSPEVLRTFEALRGGKAEQETGGLVAAAIPDIRMVESVVRLPRALREEVEALRTSLSEESGVR